MGMAAAAAAGNGLYKEGGGGPLSQSSDSTAIAAASALMFLMSSGPVPAHNYPGPHMPHQQQHQLLEAGQEAHPGGGSPPLEHAMDGTATVTAAGMHGVTAGGPAAPGSGNNQGLGHSDKSDRSEAMLLHPSSPEVTMTMGGFEGHQAQPPNPHHHHMFEAALQLSQPMASQPAVVSQPAPAQVGSRRKRSSHGGGATSGLAAALRDVTAMQASQLAVTAGQPGCGGGGAGAGKGLVKDEGGDRMMGEAFPVGASSSSPHQHQHQQHHSLPGVATRRRASLGAAAPVTAATAPDQAAMEVDGARGGGGAALNGVSSQQHHQRRLSADLSQPEGGGYSPGSGRLHGVAEAASHGVGVSPEGASGACGRTTFRYIVRIGNRWRAQVGGESD